MKLYYISKCAEQKDRKIIYYNIFVFYIKSGLKIIFFNIFSLIVKLLQHMFDYICKHNIKCKGNKSLVTVKTSDFMTFFKVLFTC